MISCCLFALTSCEIDNYESPNASIHGSIIDEKTGELVGMDVQDGGELKVVELGFCQPADSKLENYEYGRIPQQFGFCRYL